MESSFTDTTPPRVPLNVEVDCSSDDGSKMLRLSAMNLSEGGMFIKSPFPLEVGTRMVCRFDLEDGLPPIQTEAEVTWMRSGPFEQIPSPGMGVRFVELSSEDRERILAHVAASETSEELEEVGKEHALYEEPAELPEPTAEPLSPTETLARLQGACVGLSLPTLFQKIAADVRAVSSNGLAVAAPISFLGEGAVVRLDAPSVSGQPLAAQVQWLELESDDKSTPVLHMGLRLSGTGSFEKEALEKEPAEAGEPPITIGACLSEMCAAPPSPPAPAVEDTCDPQASIQEEEAVVSIKASTFGPSLTDVHLGDDQEAPAHSTVRSKMTDYHRRSYVSRKQQSRPISRMFITIVSCIALAALGAVFAVILSWTGSKKKKTKNRPGPVAEVAASRSTRPEEPDQKAVASKTGDLIKATASKNPTEPREIEKESAPIEPGDKIREGSGPKAGKPALERAARANRFQQTEAATSATIPMFRRGGDLVIRLAAQNAPTKVSHYWLKQPTAVVVDLHGAKASVRSGRYPMKGRRVRLVRVLSAMNKARFIVYLASGFPKPRIEVRKTPQGGTLTFIASRDGGSNEMRGTRPARGTRTVHPHGNRVRRRGPNHSRAEGLPEPNARIRRPNRRRTNQGQGSGRLGFIDKKRRQRPSDTKAARKLTLAD